MSELVLLPCRHRSPEISPGRYNCALSKPGPCRKLMHGPQGISAQTCSGCVFRDMVCDIRSEQIKAQQAKREKARQARGSGSKPRVSKGCKKCNSTD